MDMYIAISAAVTMLASISAAIFAFRAASGARGTTVLSQFSDVVRKEHELARTATEEQARGLRQEIGDITRNAAKAIERTNQHNRA